MTWVDVAVRIFLLGAGMSFLWGSKGGQRWYHRLYLVVGVYDTAIVMAIIYANYHFHL